jgi:hypothetical protein
MKRNAFVLAVAALLISQATLHAQVKLEHKVPDGRKTTANTHIKVEQTLTIAEMDIPTSSEQNITTTEANGKRQADGTLLSQHKIESLQSTVKVAGMEISFDSVNPDAPAAGTAIDMLVDVFKAIAGSSWKVTYGPDNRVVSVKGRADALQGLPEELRASMAKQFEDANLTAEYNQSLDVLPDGPVKKGDTWKREETVLFDGYQSMDFTTYYRYEGTVVKDGKTLDKIISKTTEVTYTMDQDSPSPLKIVDSELKVTESSGTILFDREAGMIVDSKDKKRVAGTLKCEVNGNELPGKLDLVFETTANRS